MEITKLSLAGPRSALDELRDFYIMRLGLPGARPQSAGFGVGLDRARLTFAPTDGRPFYHFALLIAGDRFEAAVAWLASRVELLTGQDSSPVFEFAAWPARAVYFLDPAGNIVELIAHPGVWESGLGDAGFDPGEIVGISEAGVVAANLPAVATSIHARAGIEVWDGDPAVGIAFLGRRAHTVILCAPGRGWLPTRRPAEAHPVAVTLSSAQGETLIVGDDAGEVEVTFSREL